MGLLASTTVQSGDARSAITGLVVLVAMIAGIVYVAIKLWRRYVVTQSSAAIALLRKLNQEYAHRLKPTWGWFRRDYADRVNTKPKYDRYDLEALFFAYLERDEKRIEAAILARDEVVHDYAEYFDAAGDLFAEHHGRSSHKHLSEDTYKRLERKYFFAMRLPRPNYKTRITVTVRYTSPKGQNSYSKHIEYAFSELVDAVQEMRDLRQLRSQTQYLRRQERNRVTPAVRAQVLKRDGCCMMCGATVADGIKLHVDHITPISRGGTSDMSNLQALCQDCNLGKSDRL